MLTLAVKPQWVRYKLEETIEKSCSDFLAHTSELCNGYFICTTGIWQPWMVVTHGERVQPLQSINLL
jgi:hypothetical protein